MTDDLATALADNTWLTEAVATVAAHPSTVDTLFPVAGRRCGRSPLPRWPEWTADDAARVVLLSRLALPRVDLVETVHRLYRAGDAAERRAVLRALPYLDVGDGCLDLLHDALRTNDTRLVAAALGPYARHLDAASWRQGVLKCVFMGVPLSIVDGIDQRADAELAAMLDGLRQERAAAGRPFPEDALAVLATAQQSA
jgi:hypothetical protein